MRRPLFKKLQRKEFQKLTVRIKYNQNSLQSWENSRAHSIIWWNKRRIQDSQVSAHFRHWNKKNLRNSQAHLSSKSSDSWVGWGTHKLPVLVYPTRRVNEIKRNSFEGITKVKWGRHSRSFDSSREILVIYDLAQEKMAWEHRLEQQLKWICHNLLLQWRQIFGKFL